MIDILSLFPCKGVPVDLPISFEIMVVMLVFQTKQVQGLLLGGRGADTVFPRMCMLIYRHADLSCKHHFGL